MIDLGLVGVFAPLFIALGLVIAGRSLPSWKELGPSWLIEGTLTGDPVVSGALGVTVVLALSYFFLFHAMAGRTPGKRALHIRLIDEHGNLPSPTRALARTLGYLVSLVTLSIGFVWIGFDREKRGLHDWVAGTYVVRG